MRKKVRGWIRSFLFVGVFATVTVIRASAVSPSEHETLLKQFVSAQQSEVKAVTHRHHFELKELKAAQDAQLREFEKKEKEARHAFFQSHTKGPERRAFVQDFIERRDALKKQLVEDRQRKNSELDLKVKTVHWEQAAKLKTFKEVLSKGEVPSKDLWPTAGQ